MDGHFVTGDGCKIAFRLDGPPDAPLLVLSNSLGTTMAMWERQIEALAKRFRVLRYDTRGHGASATPSGVYSLDRLGWDVLELLDHLQAGPVSFCGLSLGGMTAMWLGYRAPKRISRLVIANSSAYMGPRSMWQERMTIVRNRGMAAIRDAVLNRWFTEPFLATEADAIASTAIDLCATLVEGYNGCCGAIRDMDLRPMLRLIEPPTLVLAGACDLATPMDHSRLLAERIPNATLVTLDAAHLSAVEKPDEFTERVLAFLSV
jgi:3-oxoadipate enol-lactonase